MSPKRIALAVTALAAASAIFVSQPSATPPLNPDADVPAIELWKTAVTVGHTHLNDDGEREICTNSSGALVGSTDTVVTAEHVVDWSEEDKETCLGATLWVGYNFDPKAEYFIWWPAEVRRESADLDLAVLTVDLGAEPWIEDDSVDFSPLFAGDWPTLDVAPMEEEPRLGDSLQLYSFPGIAGYAVTYSSGHLAGWAYDDMTETLAGIMKLDLSLAGGSSGGAILDSRGRMVGVAVLAGVSRYPDGDERNDWDWVDCRPAADTNGDELITDKDTCLPIGGFFNGAVSLFPLRQFLIGTGVTW